MVPLACCVTSGESLALSVYIPRPLPGTCLSRDGTGSTEGDGVCAPGREVYIQRALCYLPGLESVLPGACSHPLNPRRLRELQLPSAEMLQSGRSAQAGAQDVWQTCNTPSSWGSSAIPQGASAPRIFVKLWH